MHYTPSPQQASMAAMCRLFICAVHALALLTCSGLGQYLVPSDPGAPQLPALLARLAKSCPLQQTAQDRYNGY